jgi:carbon monoxide dehydrogenase subunit G
MATARAHGRVERDADVVWAAVSDPVGITRWFPGVAECTLNGPVRHVVTTNGVEVDEHIVTNDGRLRRFQYRIAPGGVVPYEQHLATIDVLAEGDGSLVIYSGEVTPDSFGPGLQQMLDAAVTGLKGYLEP